jgi:predicted ATP-grasp superfamily ATP-dependent carboligase
MLAALNTLVVRIPRAGSGGGGALRDCVELVVSVVDQAARAVEQLHGVERVVGVEVTWRVDDARVGDSHRGPPK